jgi:hypothetical protein
MTKEERQLFLIDLSARFPYNVAVDCRSEESRFTCYLTSDMLREIQNNTCYWEYKTYLFPMSSMTREQKIMIRALQDMGPSYYHRIIDHYNEWHLDYRGFIEKGLALDATGLNIY